MKSEILKYDMIQNKKGFIQRSFKALSSFLMIMIVSGFANAETEQMGSETAFSSLSEIELLLLVSVGFLILLAMLVLIVVLYVLSFLRLISAEEKKQQGTTAEKETAEKQSLWARINKRFVSGNLVPIHEEQGITLDHTYDGISELDNHMPPWLRYIFYSTIAFAFIYLMNYMILDTGKLQLEEYEDELAEAELQAEERKLLTQSSIDENNAVFISDAAELEKAASLFVQNCAPCHGKDGGGTVGPNLTDEYWLHGGSIQDIFTVIKYGVQEKGMIPWQGKLNPEEIQSVASFILTLQGTNPANPKEPQGEKYEEISGTSEQAVVSSL